MRQLMRWKRLWRRSLTRSHKRTSMAQHVHYSWRRLLRRGLEFHVCTINKSAHTKKVWKLIACSSYMNCKQIFCRYQIQTRQSSFLCIQLNGFKFCYLTLNIQLTPVTCFHRVKWSSSFINITYFSHILLWRYACTIGKEILFRWFCYIIAEGFFYIIIFRFIYLTFRFS